MPQREARIYSAEELKAGLTAEFEREITEADVLAFGEISGDLNPLHIDADYAAKTNYGARIVHGAFQVGLASAMIGMWLPGRNVLLASVNAQFGAPLYFPCKVVVRGEIVSWNAGSERGNLKVSILQTGSNKLPVSEIFMGFTLHREKTTAAGAAATGIREKTNPVASGRKTLLVTGASGGIGSELVGRLAEEYFVIATVNRGGLPDALLGNPNVSEVRVDFSASDWKHTLERALGETPLYGVIHAAWPGLPNGGLLAVSEEVIEQQVAFGSLHTIALARLLAARVDGSGRIIVLGSTAATEKPVLGMAAYSLGKAALEHAVRLLAPELARKKITINTVSPSFVPTGMNKHVNDRQKMMLTAQVPIGRLCEPGDVLGAIRYLLSPEAAFVSGQILTLSGGQL